MNKDFIRRVLEQSFLTIVLLLGGYFIFMEYKTIFKSLVDKNNTNERLLLDKLEKCNEEKTDLYERLINCNE